MFFQVEHELSIADHPALPIEIAHPMRIYASAGAIQLRFPTMASELIFAAADPARVAIPVDAASIRHRNGQFARRIFDRRNRRGLDRDWKHDDNADKQYRWEKFFHRFDPRLCNGRCQSTRILGAPRMEGSALHGRDRIKSESPLTSARFGNRLRAVISCILCVNAHMARRMH